jgi:hypothetical protein
MLKVNEGLKRFHNRMVVLGSWYGKYFIFLWTGMVTKELILFNTPAPPPQSTPSSFLSISIETDHQNRKIRNQKL